MSNTEIPIASRPGAALVDSAEPAPPAFACSHCPNCGFNNFPATSICPRCWAEEVHVVPLSSHGILYSFSTVHGSDGLQFVGYVDLPERIRAYGLIKATHRPQCGMPVEFSLARPPGTGPCFVFNAAGWAA